MDIAIAYAEHTGEFLNAKRLETAIEITVFKIKQAFIPPTRIDSELIGHIKKVLVWTSFIPKGISKLGIIRRRTKLVPIPEINGEHRRWLEARCTGVIALDKEPSPHIALGLRCHRCQHKATE